MALFRYKVKDTKGEVISGTMDVETRSMALSRLQSMGYFPLSLEEEAKRATGGLMGGVFGARIRSADICEFYRQMADLITAGIALVRALQIVAEQTPNPALRAVIAAIANDVQGGDTFGAALGRHPCFSKLAAALIRSGEQGGFLPDVLQQLASFAELEEELRGKIKSALAYPVVMIFVMTAVVIFLMSFVMPKILTVYGESNQQLPAITQLLIAMSTFMGRQWYLAVGAPFAAIGALWAFARSRRGRRLVHIGILRMPIVGQAVLKREISRFARTLGQMLKNGVPILTALEIVKDVAANDLVRDVIEKAPPQIAQGTNMSEALKKSDLFPPGVINMILIGEETGRLPEVLLQIAPSYEAQADRSVKTLTSLIEPIIILFMGVVVGFIVIAMLLPILTINPMAQ